jgi:ribosomal protein L32
LWYNERDIEKSKKSGGLYMEINRCSRCGSFYAFEGHVCPNCITKENLELSTFRNYLEENVNETSLNTVAYETGISQKNLERFISYDSFKEYKLK